MEEQIKKKQTDGIFIVYFKNSFGILLFGHADRETWLLVDEKCKEKTAELRIENDGTILFSPPCEEDVITFPKTLNAKKTLMLEPYACNTITVKPGLYQLKKQSDPLGGRILRYLEI